MTLELYGDAFDRYTIVTLGSDGVKSFDDLIYSFNGGVIGPTLTSLRGAAVQIDPVRIQFSAPAGATLTLRGQNLGPDRVGAQILLDQTELTTIDAWSEHEIQITLPANLTPTQAALSIRRGATTSNALPLTILSNANAAQSWERYE